MAEPEKVFRFLDFEFGMRRQELRKRGHRIRISASQIRLLTLFLERRGELVTREQIVSRIWTDTGTIDVSNGVNTAINRLRSNLGDNSSSPHFLETVIGVGYRFIAPVEESMISDDAAVPVAELPETKATALAIELPSAAAASVDATPLIPVANMELPTARKMLWPRVLWGVFAALVIVVACTVVIERYRLKLTHPEARSLKPLEFSRITTNTGGNKVLAAALSPDGKLLAYADRSGIRVQTLATRSEFSLATLPTFEVTRISWVPGGEQLLASGLDISTGQRLVREVPLSGLYTPILATNANLATIAPDGNRIAFTRAEDSEVWIVGLNGENLRRLVSPEGKRIYSFLLWSPDGRRLVLFSHDGSSDSVHSQLRAPAAPLIPDSMDAVNSRQRDQWACDSVDAVTGKLLDHENVRIDSAVLPPDGRMDYVTGDSYGDSLAQGHVLSVQTDPKTGHFLNPPVSEGDLHVTSETGISASADGSKIAIISEQMTADVFTAALRFAAPSELPTLEDIQPLASNLFDSYPHAWGPDGSVIYETNLQGHFGIFGQKSQQDSPALLGQLPMLVAMPQLSPDQRWVLFLAFAPGASAPEGLYRVPVAGGKPERVPGTDNIDEFRCAQIGPIPCVMREAKGKEERLYFALDPLQGVGKLLARTAWEPSRRGDWGLSPDGSTVVVANHDARQPVLNLLKLNGASTYEGSLSLKGHGTPLGANWTKDGKALFVETRAVGNFELLYLTLSGRAQLLRNSPLAIWAIPSLDGKRIAFPHYTANSNVWIGNVR